MLTTNDHRRDSAGLKYVYPVLSRRSGGLSIGINLNTNNACNWRCIYCQVPDLKRGSAPEVDLKLLEQELRGFMDDVQKGDFFQRNQVPQEQQLIKDIALSGNGEPTSAKEFPQVINLLGKVMEDYALVKRIKLVLITNGSLLQRDYVREGLSLMSALHGEVWFKLDSATETGIQMINNVNISLDSVRNNLMLVTERCTTWIQTCLFALDGQPPSVEEQQAYLDFLASLKGQHHGIAGVLLYGIARPSLQPEAERLSRLPEEWLESFADRIRQLGFTARTSP